jgi:hypothetical protein
VHNILCHDRRLPSSYFWHPIGIHLDAMANKKPQPRLSPETLAYLEDLAATGAFGGNPSAVARTLIEAGIRDALAKGIIAIRRRPES